MWESYFKDGVQWRRTPMGMSTAETTETTESMEMPLKGHRRMLRPHAGNKSRSDAEPRPKQQQQQQEHQLELQQARASPVTLEEVVAYECYFEPGINDVSWLADSDVEISYRDGAGDPAILDLTDGHTRQHSTDTLEHDGRRMMNSGKSEEDQVETPIAAREVEDEEATFRQHVAMTWNCFEDEERDRRCRYSVYVLSSAMDKAPAESAKELVSHFSTLPTPPADAAQGHRQQQRIGPIVHRRGYSLQPLDVGSDGISNTLNPCTIKSLKEYEWTWNSQWIQPKYTVTVSETCPTHRQSWTDEFAFDPRRIEDYAPPQALLGYPGQRRRGASGEPEREEYKGRGRDEKRRRDRGDDASPSSPSIDRLRASPRTDDNEPNGRVHQRGSTGDNSASAGDCEGMRKGARGERNNASFEGGDSGETSAKGRRRHVEEPDLVPRGEENDYLRHVVDSMDKGLRRKRFGGRGERWFKRKSAFESIRIGDTGWILHTVVHFSHRHNQSTLNMAVSSAESLAQESRSREAHRIGADDDWIPSSGERHKPLLADELYVTRILSARLVSEAEAVALVHFVAAPVSNVSRRYLYRVKVVYPPLEYSTLEPVRCLTCPDERRPNSPSEGGRRKSAPGQRPRCIYSEVSMSNNAQNYILNCRGPELPWTAVVSTRSNLVLHRLDDFAANLRAWHSSKPQPLRREFEVELEGVGSGFWAPVRLHLPPHWENNTEDEIDGCEGRPKLLLRLADEQDGQMVNAEFDLSLMTYLTSVRGYAVLYADVRASAFRSLDHSSLKLRRRESMQIADYTQVAQRVAEEFGCIDVQSGFGAFGEAYGGHMVLNLVAGSEDGGAESVFRCGAAVKPFAAWQPHTTKASSELVGALGKKLHRRRYLAPLARRLRGKDFALFTGEPYRYEGNLLKLLERHDVDFEHRRYADECSSRLRLYEDLGSYFDRCFRRQSSGRAR